MVTTDGWASMGRRTKGEREGEQAFRLSQGGKGRKLLKDGGGASDGIFPPLLPDNQHRRDASVRRS